MSKKSKKRKSKKLSSSSSEEDEKEEDVSKSRRSSRRRQDVNSEKGHTSKHEERASTSAKDVPSTSRHIKKAVYKLSNTQSADPKPVNNDQKSTKSRSAHVPRHGGKHSSKEKHQASGEHRSSNARHQSSSKDLSRTVERGHSSTSKPSKNSVPDRAPKKKEEIPKEKLDKKSSVSKKPATTPNFDTADQKEREHNVLKAKFIATSSKAKRHDATKDESKTGERARVSKNSKNSQEDIFSEEKLETKSSQTKAPESKNLVLTASVDSEGQKELEHNILKAKCIATPSTSRQSTSTKDGGKIVERGRSSKPSKYSHVEPVPEEKDDTSQVNQDKKYSQTSPPESNIPVTTPNVVSADQIVQEEHNVLKDKFVAKVPPAIEYVEMVEPSPTKEDPAWRKRTQLFNEMCKRHQDTKLKVKKTDSGIKTTSAAKPPFISAKPNRASFVKSFRSTDVAENASSSSVLGSVAPISVKAVKSLATPLPFTTSIAAPPPVPTTSNFKIPKKKAKQQPVDASAGGKNGGISTDRIPKRQTRFSDCEATGSKSEQNTVQPAQSCVDVTASFVSQGQHERPSPSDRLPATFDTGPEPWNYQVSVAARPAPVCCVGAVQRSPIDDPPPQPPTAPQPPTTAPQPPTASDPSCLAGSSTVSHVSIPGAQMQVVEELHLARCEKRLEVNVMESYGELTCMEIDPPEEGAQDTLCKPSPQQDLILVLDTNILLSHLDYVKKMKFHGLGALGLPVVLIPWVVLQELDYLKKGRGLSGSAAHLATPAISYIYTCLKSRTHRLWGQSMQQAAQSYNGLNAENNDDRVLQCCLQYQSLYPGCALILCTNDKNLCSKALLSGVKALSKNDLESEVGQSRQGFNPLLEFKTSIIPPPPSISPQAPVSSSALRRSYTPNQPNQPHNTSLSDGRTERDNNWQSRTDEEDQTNLRCHSELEQCLCAALSDVLETEMKAAFDELWLEIVYKKPPWTLLDVLQCLKKHWIAVFGHIVPRRKQQSVQNLLDFFNSGKSVDASATLAAAQEAMELVEAFGERSSRVPGAISTMNNIINTLQPQRVSPTSDVIMNEEDEDSPPSPPLPHQDVWSLFENIWSEVYRISMEVFKALCFDPHAVHCPQPAGRPTPPQDALDCLHQLTSMAQQLLQAFSCVLSSAPGLDEIQTLLNTLSILHSNKVIQVDSRLTAKDLFDCFSQQEYRERLSRGGTQLAQLKEVLDRCVETNAQPR